MLPNRSDNNTSTHYSTLLSTEWVDRLLFPSYFPPSTFDMRRVSLPSSRSPPPAPTHCTPLLFPGHPIFRSWRGEKRRKKRGRIELISPEGEKEGGPPFSHQLSTSTERQVSPYTFLNIPFTVSYFLFKKISWPTLYFSLPRERETKKAPKWKKGSFFLVLFCTCGWLWNGMEDGAAGRMLMMVPLDREYRTRTVLW